MMKKQIIVLSQNAVFDLGSNAGKEVVFRTLLGLSNQFQIHLIAPGSDPHVEDCIFYPLKDVWFNRFKSIPFLGYLFNFIHVHFLRRSIVKIIKKARISPDIAYLAGPWMSEIGHSLFTNKIPIVCRYFGVNWNPEKYHTIRQKLKFIQKKRGYKQFGNLVIMTNDGTRGDEYMLKLGCPPSKLRFWKNGVNFPEITLDKTESKEVLVNQWNIDNKHSILLTVSRLASWKKVDRSIRALHVVLQTNPNVTLIVVGDGEERAKLMLLAMDLGVERNVVFTGAIKHADLGIYYSGTNVFLSFYDYSNAGNPLFEAMMHSCCIISINSPAMKDFISNNSAVLLPNFDMSILANELIDLLGNQSKQIQLGEAANIEINSRFKNWDDRIQLEILEIMKLIQG
jgi:glycosyltransferase involved in cell wall biosynthesis